MFSTTVLRRKAGLKPLCMRCRPPVSIALIGIFFCTAIISFAQTPQEAIDLALAHDNDIAAARAGTVAAEYE
jgi:hypothetical protein